MEELKEVYWSMLIVRILVLINLLACLDSLAERLIGIRFSDVAGECPTNPLRSGGFMRFM